MSDNLDNTPINSDEAAAGEVAAEKLTPETAETDADALAGEVEEEAAAVLPPAIGTEAARLRLGGMYRSWFLDYASYVILERAVPQARAASHSPFNEDP